MSTAAGFTTKISFIKLLEDTNQARLVKISDTIRLTLKDARKSVTYKLVF